MSSDEMIFESVIYVVFGLLFGVIIRDIKIRLKASIPYTGLMSMFIRDLFIVIVLIIGVAIGGIAIGIGIEKLGILGSTIESVATINPHLLLHVFIPTLIFSSAFSISFHTFWREFGQALVLAIPGVVINIILLSVICKFVLPYEWSFLEALLFSSIISATDPVAVVSLLRELGVSKRLATLIEAESLLNDGSAYVCFTIIIDAIIDNSKNTFTYIILKSFRLSILGPILGISIGLLTSLWVSTIFRDELVETTLTIIAAYLTFYISESTIIHTSGVLACVFLGLTLAKYKNNISSKSLINLHHVWRLLDFFGNTLIFFTSGIILVWNFSIINKSNWVNILWLILLYFGIHLTRALSLLILLPILYYIGYGTNWKDQVILLYGSLRGAISLSLALITRLDEEVSTKQYRDLVTFHISGLVFLTLVINATTIKYIIKILKIDIDPNNSNHLIILVLNYLKRESDKLINILCQNNHFSGANWSNIRSKLPDYKTLLTIRSSDMKLSNYSNQCSIDIRKRFICSMKSFYWKQHNDGMTSKHAYIILVEAAEEALDQNNIQVHWDMIHVHFRIPFYVKYLEKIRFLQFLTNYILYRRLSLAIHLLTSFILASERMGIIVNTFPEWKGVPEMKVVEKEIDYLIMKARSEWRNVQKCYPEIYAEIQTKNATVFILNRIEKRITKMEKDGIVQKHECKEMKYKIDKIIKKISLSKQNFVINSEEIFNNLPFIVHKTTEEKKKILSKCEYKIFSQNEIIYEKNSTKSGCFVIIKGLVEFSINLFYKETSSSGSLINIWSVISKNPSLTDCKALTNIKAIKITNNALTELLKDPVAEEALWRNAAQNVIRENYLNEFVEDSIAIGNKCYTASFVKMTGEIKLCNDALLLSGVARNTNSLYHAPTLITSNNKSIINDVTELDNAILLVFNGEREIRDRVCETNIIELDRQESLGMIYVKGSAESLRVKTNIPPLIRESSLLDAWDRHSYNNPM